MKIIEALKSHLVSIIIGAVVLIGVFIKDVFNEGANVKFNKRVIEVIISKESLDILDHRIDSSINRTMKDPIVWFDILSSNHVEQYAEDKAVEIKAHVTEQIMKEDSLKGDLVHELGEGTGMRNEDVMPELIKLLKAYKDGRLFTSRTVRANF